MNHSNWRRTIVLLGGLLASRFAFAASPLAQDRAWAVTPPMGWNSWDCFGTAVTEKDVKANADYMAQHLAQYGWKYIVVDIQWYEPNAKAHGYDAKAKLTMDGFGRLLVVAYYYRGEDEIRVISARFAESHERRTYQEN